MLCLSLACSTFMIIYSKRENRTRASGDRDDRLVGGNGQLGYRHPSFRYTT